MSHTYSPIFFEKGWIHEKYYGWRVIFNESDFKVLGKRQGVIGRILILSKKKGEQYIDQLIAELRLLTPFSVIVFHDFFHMPIEVKNIGGKPFKLSSSEERLLNIGTFVVDLSSDLDLLWQKMGAKSRNMCRKAQELGVVVEISDIPAEKDLDTFFDYYAMMAREKGLRNLNRDVIGRMFQNCDLLMIACRDKEYNTLMINLIYMTKTHAVYLYGVSGNVKAPGAGQYIQFETIKCLKSRSLKWYDLGGVASTDPNDPIYRFKKSIGGDFVDLGSEYCFVPSSLAIPYAFYKSARQMLRR